MYHLNSNQLVLFPHLKPFYDRKYSLLFSYIYFFTNYLKKSKCPELLPSDISGYSSNTSLVSGILKDNCTLVCTLRFKEQRRMCCFCLWEVFVGAGRWYEPRQLLGGRPRPSVGRAGSLRSWTTSPWRDSL